MQKLHEPCPGCDADVVILMIEQVGGIACHIGWEDCSHRVFENSTWKIVGPVLKDPDVIYEHAGHHHD